MQLILSPAFDNGVGLELPHELGMRHVGPNGLTSWLEAELALPAVETSHTQSVMDYLTYLQDERHVGRFFSASLQNGSAISTAETLLRWRNTLYEHGWDGSWSDEQSRLADMAAVECSGANKLMFGLGQRCQRICERLEVFNSQLIKIEVINRHSLPPVIETLLAKLSSMGVVVEEHESLTVNGTGDLSIAQECLIAPASEIAFDGDGSLFWLQAQSLQMAVRWVVEQLHEDSTKRIAIYAPNDAESLDDALAVAGLPMAGLSSRSSARPVLQLLPLTLKLLIAPLDPQALLQFLTHPVGPLPYRLRVNLAEVLANKPGIGSAAWQQVVDHYFERLAEDHPKRAVVQRKLLANWLESDRYSRESMPVSAISKQLQLLRRWMQGIAANFDDHNEWQLYQQAISQIDEVDLAVLQLAADGGEIGADDLHDIVHQVRSHGSQMNGREAQAGHVTVLNDAGCFVPELESGMFDSVIWLGVEEQTTTVWPWFQSEQEALRKQGVKLPEQAILAHRSSSQATRVLLAAKEKVVLVQLQRNKAAHPLLAKLRNRLGDNFTPYSMSDFMLRPTSKMAKVEPIQLPVQQRWWELDGKTMTSEKVRWSYSRVSQLLSSPHEYVFNYLAKIRNDDLLTLSDGPLLKGSLVHLLVEDFFGAHKDDWREPNNDALALWARKHLNVLISEQGAVLIQPGRHVEAEQFKDAAVLALQHLMVHLRSPSVAGVEVEKKQEALFGGDDFLGFIDLLVTHTDGSETVIDMKWGGLGHRREEIRDNRAMQLATYGWLRRQNGAELWPDHGFYIITNTQLLMTNQHHFPLATQVEVTDAGSLPELWRAMGLTLEFRQQQLKAGEVEITIPGVEQNRDVETPVGGLTFKDSVAPWSNYTHLTGWE
jgi:hypothetical protein